MSDAQVRGNGAVVVLGITLAMLDHVPPIIESQYLRVSLSAGVNCSLNDQIRALTIFEIPEEQEEMVFRRILQRWTIFWEGAQERVGGHDMTE